MCRRVLGESTGVRSAVELSWGSYNTTFRVELAHGSTVVLRVAPRPERQLRSERHWLRSEYTAAAWLSELAPLVPRMLGADFTHQVVGRDYLVQSLVNHHWVLTGFEAIEALVRPGPYACGGAITVADLCLVPQVYNARRLNVPLDKFPKIVAIDSACLALPAFDRARPENQPDAE